MKYLRLMPDIFFETTNENGCFYHLLEKRIQYWTENENEILKLLITDNIPVEEVINKYANANSLIEKLCSDGDAYLFDYPVFCEQAQNNSEVETRGYLETAPQFENIYIQVTNDCGSDCEFCKKELTNHPCHCCYKWINVCENSMDDLNFKKAINQIKNLKTTNVVFSGGEPLLEFDKIKTAIEIFKDSQEIPWFWIKTPLSCDISDDDLIYLGDNGVGIDIVKIEGRSAQNAIKEKYINRMDEFGVNYKESVLITNNTTNNVVDSQCAEIKNVDRKLNTINGFEEVQNRFPTNFLKQKRFNECFSLNIALEKSGVLKPCPHLKFSYGTFTEENLNQMFRKFENDNFLRLTKHRIDGCKSCSLKYVCNSDCTKYNLEIKGDCKVLG